MDDIVVSQGNARTAKSGQVKLRDSCNSCSVSKVRCDKTKPVCGRCATRGTPCEYLAARRTGRAGYRRKTERPRETEPSSTHSSPSEAQRNEFSLPPNSLAMTSKSPALPIASHPAHISSNGIPQFDDSLALPSAADTGFDDAFTSLGDDLLFGTPNIQPSPPLHAPTDGGIVEDFDFTAFPGLDDIAIQSVDGSLLDFGTPLDVHHRGETRSSQASYASQSQLESLTSATCPCLLRALALLQQLLSDNAGRRQSQEGIESVLDSNKRALEETKSLLRCQCGRDGYVLSIMILILFKILSSYATAFYVHIADTDSSDSSASSPDDPFRQRPSSRPRVIDARLTGRNSFSKGPRQVEHGEPIDGRLGAQAILSELHLVQNLINEVLQQCRFRRSSSETPSTSTTADDQDLLAALEHGSPLSDTLLDQLESDLRKRLRTLSLEIVETLRLI